jgi:hypothetical protein
MLEYDRCGGKEGKIKNSRIIQRPYITLLHIHIVIFWFTTLSKLAYMATLYFVLTRLPVTLSAGTFSILSMSMVFLRPSKKVQDSIPH